MNETLGQVMDRLEDKTVLDLHFTHDDAPRYAVPDALATHPTAATLRTNQYLRALPIEQRDRYSTPYIPNGYDIYIPAAFDKQAWKTSRQ